MRVAGIEVDGALVDQWVRWLMPVEQPFVVPRVVADDLGLADGRERLTFEVGDSFELYGITRDEAIAYVERDRISSQHREVSGTTWNAVAAVLPGARGLAGTFASGSGPNCFGTVLAAAGVPDAEFEWMQLAPFEDWLRSSTTPVRRGDDAGTVYVWRDVGGVPAHAAVSLGDGWPCTRSRRAGCRRSRFCRSVTYC